MSQSFFICIGAQKSGTTTLYYILRDHPQIFMPPFKELHFFDRVENKRGGVLKNWFSNRQIDIKNRERTVEALKNILLGRAKPIHLWILKYAFIPRNIRSVKKYKELLSSLTNQNALIGEITPAYAILRIETIEEIHRIFPDLKVVFILRDLIEREWSAAKMELLKIKRKSRPEYNEIEFKSFLKKNSLRSNYMRTIQNWTTFYGPDQILFLFYDDMVKNLLDFVNQILTFLKVTPLTNTVDDVKKNIGIPFEIPENIERLLFEKHEDQLIQLSDFFKEYSTNYPDLWLKKYRSKFIKDDRFI